MATFLEHIDKDRIFDGMNKILLSDTPTTSLNLLWDSGWLSEVFPELERMARFRTKKSKSKDLWKHVLQVVENCPKDPVLRWAALFHDVGKPVTVRDTKQGVTFHGHEQRGSEIWTEVAKRLSAPELFIEIVAVIIRESGSFVELKDANVADNLSDAGIRRYLKRIGPYLDGIFRFTMADMTSKWDRKLDKMRQETRDLMSRIEDLVLADRIEAQKPRLPKGTGTLLMEELGLRGKDLGDVMQELKDKLERDGSIDDIKEAARKISVCLDIERELDA